MSPSPNRSSKSRKSSKAQSAQPSEQAVNQPNPQPAIAETAGESVLPPDSAQVAGAGEMAAPADGPPAAEIPPSPLQSPDVEEPATLNETLASAETPPPPQAVVAGAESIGNGMPQPEGEAIAAAEADAEDHLDSEAVAASRQPISPPSEPRQYRAVGLVRGRYSPSEEQFTRGMLLASDGTAIDAVLLGRVMSLVKNHLNLEQEHLWVVYPRTRQQDGNLHTQIMGVWEPETLSRKDEGDSEEEAIDLQSQLAYPSVEDGYFSIRGEVIYQSQDADKYVIVKIKQAARKDGDKTKFFKLKLKGALAEKAVGHFFDFHAQLEGNTIMIQEANDIGSLPVKKQFKPGGGKGKRPFSPRGSDGQRPTRPNFKPAAGGPPVRKEAVPKPVKRSKPTEG